MLSHRLPLARVIRSGRPLKPSNPTKTLPNHRLFTQNSQLLLVSHATPRPQLPFLHPATGGRSSPGVPRNQLQYQLARLLTTERKLYLKDQLWKGAKYTVYGWAALVLLAMMTFGVQSEVADRRFPAPPEWTKWSRFFYRTAKTREIPHPQTGLTDWSKTGYEYLDLLRRLEDPSIDGRGLRPILQDEGDLYVAGIGKAGLDISAKSEPWRRGYYTCLMGIAKAAENRDGWVEDTTRGLVFPPELVIGPSNPCPKPVPYGAMAAPHEEDCVPAFEPAETYYMKILTTHGFNTRQRLDAALAYADWLDFKGLSSTADEMYDWGLDIAMGALPLGIDNVIDIKTGVINRKATYISANVLLATTSMAYHHARNNNVAAALPIFLSVLRARRQLPNPTSTYTERNPHADSTLSPVFSFFRSLIVTPPYPEALPTGDEVPFRTPAAMCEEAAVMSHIGEILFASSGANSFATMPSNTSVGPPIATTATAGQLKNQQLGLSWTRDSVNLAEETINLADKDDLEARDKCSECLAVGMENWSTMVSKLLKDEGKARAGPQQKSGSSWFWSSSAITDEGQGRWEREAKVVDERLRSVRKILIREADRKDKVLL